MYLLTDGTEEDYRIGLTLVSEKFLEDPEGYQRYLARSAADAIDVIAARQAMRTHKPAREPYPLGWHNQ